MKSLAVITALLFSLSLQAQYAEVGLMLGGANYAGELDAADFGDFAKKTGYNVGIFGRYNVSSIFSAKLNMNFAKITGDDYESSDETRRMRNLHFESNVFEVGATGELYFLGFNPYHMASGLSPYVFVGFALFSYNPMTEYLGDMVELQPLGTEGQGMPGFEAPYKLTQWSVPMGFGVKFGLTDKINLGFEFGARRAFTDYIDDVSGTYVEYDELLQGNGQLAAALGNRTGEYLNTEPVSVPTGTIRGDANASDWYFLFGFTASYNFLDNGLVGQRRRVRAKNGCRTN